MTKIFAALALAALATTPALANSYQHRVSDAAAPAYAMQADEGYGANAYAPGATWQTGTVWENGSYAGTDPDFERAAATAPPG